MPHTGPSRSQTRRRAVKPSKTLFAGIAIAVGAGLAAPNSADAQEEVVEYRQSLMQAFRMHMGGVGEERERKECRIAAH